MWPSGVQGEVAPGDDSGRNIYAGLLAAMGALLLAVPLWVHAAKCLFGGHMHMDELVALAILAAMAIGEYQTAGVVAFFLLLSNLIETRTALGARAAIEGLMRLTPTKAHRILPDGSEERVDAHALRAGDVVHIRPGDNIPADGVILSGGSTINEANITGESLPVEKSAGDDVFGGTTNLTGALQVKVTKVGHDTTLGRVQELILDAERTKIPLMRMIDQYAAWYTPVTLMIAGVVWFFTRDMTVTISLLVIACPCALILATPTAVVAALSAAARLGIYIKDVSNLGVGPQAHRCGFRQDRHAHHRRIGGDAADARARRGCGRFVAHRGFGRAVQPASGGAGHCNGRTACPGTSRRGY